MRLPGLGPKTARRIWQELGIDTVAALQAAAEGGQLQGHAGNRARDEDEDRRGAEQAAGRRGTRRDRCSGRPCRSSRGCRARWRRTRPPIRSRSRARLGGCARRFATWTSSRRPPIRQALIDDFCGLPWVVEIAAKGGTKATVVSNDGLRFDLRVVPPESYGNLLQHFTGSKDHNVALREDAVRRGFSVSEYGITDVESGEEHHFATEDEVYAFLGYD